MPVTEYTEEPDNERTRLGLGRRPRHPRAGALPPAGAPDQNRMTLWALFFFVVGVLIIVFLLHLAGVL
jgi:hypothetical protein